MLRRASSLLFVVTVLGGCPEQTSSSDAGTSMDDAGAETDGGTSIDAGTLADGGPRADAGEPADAGGAGDGGADRDAGEPGDAGGSADAGGPGDAGTPSDAGDTAVPDGGAGDAGAPATGEVCAAALEVSAGSTLTGSTVGTGDDYGAEGAGCPFSAFTGGDLVYRLAPEATQSFEITVIPEGSFDPMLYVLSDCAAETCLAGTVFNGPGEPESVTVEVQAGAEAFIVVDGEAVSEGAFTLEVRLPGS